MHFSENNKIKLTGSYVLRVAKIKTDEDKKLEHDILSAIEKGEDAGSLIARLNKNARTIHAKNVVTLGLHTMIADAITSPTPANEIRINYAALGEGTSTPNTNDNQLDTELFRKPISSISSVGNVVYVTVFYSSTEVDGTFFEHGFFSDADDTINSGIMINRVLLDAPAGIAKSNTETLTIDYTLTIQ